MTNIFRHLRLAFTMIALFSTALVNANAEEGEFDAGETILHHVQDAHEIHIAGDFAIPLPIIIFDEGMKVFSSSNFYHNAKEVMNYKKERKNITSFTMVMFSTTKKFIN